MTLCVEGGWVEEQEVSKTMKPVNANNKNMLKTKILMLKTNNVVIAMIPNCSSTNLNLT
jgi:hypothetical protein